MVLPRALQVLRPPAARHPHAANMCVAPGQFSQSAEPSGRTQALYGLAVRTQLDSHPRVLVQHGWAAHAPPQVACGSHVSGMSSR